MNGPALGRLQQERLSGVHSDVPSAAPPSRPPLDAASLAAMHLHENQRNAGALANSGNGMADVLEAMARATGEASGRGQTATAATAAAAAFAAAAGATPETDDPGGNVA